MRANSHSADRRTQVRMRCLKGGRVVLANGNSTLACRIRNQSADGLRLAADEAALIPETFSLVQQPAPGKTTSHMCRIAWRNASEVGAVVLGPADTQHRPARHAARNTQLVNRYPV